LAFWYVNGVGEAVCQQSSVPDAELNFATFKASPTHSRICGCVSWFNFENKSDYASEIVFQVEGGHMRFYHWTRLKIDLQMTYTSIKKLS
jgi:hypothetical protein